MKPDWGKGYSRKAAALHGQGDLGKFSRIAVDTISLTGYLVGALDAYEYCLKIEPNNTQAKQGLASVNEAIRREAEADGVSNPDMGLASIFSDPNWLKKLADNPKTAPLLGDQTFMEKLVRIKQNPSTINQELRDPRMMQVIAVLLGLNIEMGDSSPPPNSEDTPVSILA